MQIEYKKNMKHSYMVVIEHGEVETRDARIAEKVFSGFAVDDLIPVRTLPYDGDMTFWFNITGKISLREYMSSRKADSGFMDKLMSSLWRLHENLLRFYLCEDHIILGDETIFLDDSGTEVFFCYDHMYCESFVAQLAGLMEKLLSVIDHQDEAAVGMGYGLYEQCIRENADIFREITGLRRKVLTDDRRAIETVEEEQATQAAEMGELESKTVSLAELDEKLNEAVKNNSPIKRKMRDLAVNFAAAVNTISDRLEYHKWDT